MIKDDIYKTILNFLLLICGILDIILLITYITYSILLQKIIIAPSIFPVIIAIIVGIINILTLIYIPIYFIKRKD